MTVKEIIWENLAQFVEDSVSNAAIPGAYWYPLEILAQDIPVAAYDKERLLEEHRDLVEAVLRTCGIETVTKVELEVGPEGVSEGQNIFDLLNEQREYEIRDFRFWKPRRKAAAYVFPEYFETYFFDDSQSWLLYLSHEDSITFAGAEFAAAARRIIPDEYRCWLISDTP